MVLGVGNSQLNWTSPASVDTWRPLKTFSWESRPKVHQVEPLLLSSGCTSLHLHHPTLSEQLWIKVPAQCCTFQLQDQCNCATCATMLHFHLFNVATCTTCTTCATCATSAAGSDGFPALFSHAPGPWTQPRPSKQC